MIAKKLIPDIAPYAGRRCGDSGCWRWESSDSSWPATVQCRSGCEACSNQVERFWAQVGIASEHFPILVTGNERDLLDLKACLEQSAGPFMTKVMKMQVRDSEAFAGPCERRAG